MNGYSNSINEYSNSMNEYSLITVAFVFIDFAKAFLMDEYSNSINGYPFIKTVPSLRADG